MSIKEEHSQANAQRDMSLSFDGFLAVDLRAGTVVRVEDFPEARIPAWKVWVDFGEDIGILRSSARITDYYTKETLLGMQIAGVVNFPPRQIGPFMSEFLVTGFIEEDGKVVLAVPERPVKNGMRLA